MSGFFLKDFNKKPWVLFPSESECFPKEMLVNWRCVSPLGSPSQYPRRGGCSHLEVELSASSVLGQPHQKPRLRLRHWQVQHRRLLFVSHRSDVHGRLQHLWARPGKGQPKLKTTLCQGHSSLQRLGRPVRLLNPVLYPRTIGWACLSAVMSRFSESSWFSALNTGDGAWSHRKYAISI